MVQINDLDAQKFTLNGIEYFKNFTPIVVGNLITIVNTYDSKIVIVPLTIFSDFEVDGNNFANVGLLQSALLPVVFTRAGLGDFLSSDETSYPDATLPLSGTEKFILNDGLSWKKITWDNIKAQLKNYLDTIYQAILISGTNIKTINGSSILGSGNLEVGGSDYLFHAVKWKTCRFNTINTWRTPTPFPDFYDTETFASHGTGTAPVDGGAGLYASWNQIPAGFLIDSFELNVNLKLVNSGSTSSNLQVYIERAEASTDSVSVSSSNVVVLVNQVVSIGAGSDRMKFMKTLTVASHSAPTLAKSFYRIWARETTTTDVYYSLAFNPIFKKI